MNHPITPENWIDYVDGSLSVSKTRILEAHLLDCCECRQTASQLRDVEDVLASMAADDPRALLTSAEMEQAKGDFVTGLQASDLSSRLKRAHNLLTPICGAGITDRVLRTAARRAFVRSPENMTAHDWPDFIAHLTRIMVLMCGEPTAAALVEGLAQ